MKTKLEWSVTVNATEKVEDIREWSAEVERGLIASDMIPVEARMTTLQEGFGGTPYCTFRWETMNEMEHAENYKTA